MISWNCVFPLGESAKTLAEQFQKAGYATYGVQSNGWLAATFGFQQGFDRYVFPRGANVPWMKSMVWPHADNVYLEAERLLDAHDSSDPFFLYLHFMDAHEYAAPAAFQQFGTDNAGAYRAAIRWIDHVLERLRAELDAYQQRASVPGVVRSGIRIDPQIADKLRALGYLQ